MRNSKLRISQKYLLVLVGLSGRQARQPHSPPLDPPLNSNIMLPGYPSVFIQVWYEPDLRTRVLKFSVTA